MRGRLFFIIFVAIAAITGSCGGKPDYSNMSAEQMFMKASKMSDEKKRFFSRNDKKIPLEMLKEIQIRHAFSSYTPLASLKTADIYFIQEKYKTASDQYKKFLEDNPKHEKREYAMHRLFESFYSIKESYQRDQRPCKQAIYWGQSFLSYHPESEYKDETLSKIQTCFDTIAKGELEIGKFYLKRKKYKAARRRFLYLADNFPQTEAARQSEALIASIPEKEEKKAQ